MSRDAFIGELRHKLTGIPQEAVDRTVEYYSELIADSMEDGLSEEERDILLDGCLMNWYRLGKKVEA